MPPTSLMGAWISRSLSCRLRRRARAAGAAAALLPPPAEAASAAAAASAIAVPCWGVGQGSGRASTSCNDTSGWGGQQGIEGDNTNDNSTSTTFQPGERAHQLTNSHRYQTSWKQRPWRWLLRPPGQTCGSSSSSSSRSEAPAGQSPPLQPGAACCRA